MRKAAVASLLAFFAAPVLCAQAKDSGIVTITLQQCIWRAGDNPTWSSADLDEASWQPYSGWKFSPSEQRIWIRCHLQPMAPGEFDRPAVQVSLAAAYELFMNGAPIGRNGDLHSGFFSLDSIRIFPVPLPLAGNRSNLLSLRIVYRFASQVTTGGTQAPEIRLGGTQALRDNRAGVLVSLLPNSLISFVPLVMLGIAGLVLLGFSVPDRQHPEPILLGLSCVFVGLMMVNILCGSMMTNEPAWAYVGLYSLTATANMLAQTSFYFALSRKRIPVWFRLFIGAWFVCAAWPLVELLLPLQPALRLDSIHYSIIDPSSFIILAVLLGCGPLVAFWPYRRIPAGTRAVAGLSAAWGAILLVFFLAIAANYIPGVPNFFQSLQSTLFPVQSIAQACVVAALIALVVREQRQIAAQRSALAGEMEAAQRMQRALIPASIDSFPGLKIDASFSPAREVGGDFYSCRILPAGHQRILLGDVSGKGAAAAMTAAVLLGAAERREKDSPAELLRHLNLVLSDFRLGGFTTCLCADIFADGFLTLANAGHLAPYRNGDEIPTPPGLPLGITTDVAYIETTLTLAPGDALTFVSDGVVEAKSPTGELFGFDRTRAISGKSAESIAQAARDFGQEDDITVLTLTFNPVTVPA
jgi:sigma-B regulation protein RsbU (phosphoserine phosphatase)